MSPGTHIKLLLNRLCIRTQTEEKEHRRTPTAPTAAPPFDSPPLPLSPRLCSMLGGGVKEEGRQWRCGWEHTQCPVPHCFQMKWHSLCLPCTAAASLMSSPLPQTASNVAVPRSRCTVLACWERTHGTGEVIWASASAGRFFFFFFTLKKKKKAALDSSTVDEQALGDVLVQHCSACLSPSPLPLHRCASCHAWQWIIWLINYIFFD